MAEEPESQERAARRMRLLPFDLGDLSRPLRELPAAALRESLREGYDLSKLRADVLSGLVVGVVALPLAMALAIAVGVPPQHGLYTVVIAGFVVAALGGSRTQVTGPTAAFVVVLAPIYSAHGMAGLLVAAILGGLILIAMGLSHMGRLIELVPHPVTTGFTAGIATVIATLQMKDLFGLSMAHPPEHFVERVGAMIAARNTATPRELVVGLGTLALLVLLRAKQSRIPGPLIALPLAAAGAALAAELVPGFEVATIGSRFHAVIDGEVVRGIPPVPPQLGWPLAAGGPHGEELAFDFGTLRALLPAAFAVAMLGAIESLLSAVVADGMARTKHDPDAELFALGVGNVLTGFFGGLPATGALARTATNIRSGGRTPIAAMVHALTVLVAMLALAPLLSYLPMAALAAQLLLVAWNMSEAKHVAHTLRVAPRSDVIVLLTCFGLTVVFDMVVGVAVGMVLAAFLFMRRMAEVTQVTRLEGGSATTERPTESLLTDLPEGVLVYEISGPLFFGAAHKAMAALRQISDRCGAVVLLLHEVNALDATGLVALESALETLAGRKCLAVLAGVHGQPLDALERARLHERPLLVSCATASEAIEVASKYVREHPRGSLRPARASLPPASA